MSKSNRAILKLYNDIERMNNRAKKDKRLMEMREQGTEPKCKVCNHELRKEIEDLREDCYSYREILEKLDLTEEISEMSLSRHFRFHYPKAKAFKDHQDKMEYETVHNSIVNYPMLKPYFEEDENDFIETFIYNKGFCLTGCKLCSQVAKGNVLDGTDVINGFNRLYYDESDKSFYSSEKKLISYTRAMLNCNKCLNIEKEDVINILGQLVFNKLSLGEFYFQDLALALNINYGGEIEDIIKDIESNKLKGCY